MSRFVFGLFSFAVCLFSAVSVFAEVKLPAIFGTDMVLQRDLSCPVWGWADPGEEIKVNIADQTKTAKADTEGKWSVKLDPMDAGGPFTMYISGENTLKFDNIMVGEVWFCSGQSNMAWNVANSNRSRDEIAKADFPNIRSIRVPTISKTTPQDDFQGKWEVCSPKTVGNFSAVAYFFGRQIHQDTKVAVGLINDSWGGSSCEAWLNPEVAAKSPEFVDLIKSRAEAEKTKPDGGDNKNLGYLYNGMIRPIVGYGIRGTIWYQGESNSSRAVQYRTLFPAMIQNWRDEWKQGDFPFYWVQLANFMQTEKNPSASGGWAMVREAQSMARSLKNTGEAVIIDIGDAGDIHPRNKQDVGKRLALLAMNDVYGKKVPCESPRFKTMEVQGGKAVLTFDFAYEGLYAKGALPTGFAIAGEDKVFHWASAEISGKDTVSVSSPQVAQPVAVRYGWASNPVVNMYNSANLPMCPFRTDVD